MSKKRIAVSAAFNATVGPRNGGKLPVFYRGKKRVLRISYHGHVEPDKVTPDGAYPLAMSYGVLLEGDDHITPLNPDDNLTFE